MIPRFMGREKTDTVFLLGALMAAMAMSVALFIASRRDTAPLSEASHSQGMAPSERGVRLRAADDRTSVTTAASPTPSPTPPPAATPTAAAQVAGQIAAPRPPAVPPPPPPQPPPAPPAPPPAEPVLDAGLAAELLALVNAERSARGVAPLALHAALVASSTDYALTSLRLDWHQHTGPDGRTLADRIRAAGFAANVMLGEVMGWGWGGWAPVDIVRSWVESPPHEQVIFSPAFSFAGAGCAIRFDADGRRIHCVIDLAGQ